MKGNVKHQQENKKRIRKETEGLVKPDNTAYKHHSVLVQIRMKSKTVYG